MYCTSPIRKNLALAAALALAAWGGLTPAAARTNGRGLDRRRETADKLTNLGVALVAHGRTEEALRDYREALAIERALGDRRREADTLGNMARAYTVPRKTEKALEVFAQELDIWRELHETGEEGYCLINIGRVYAQMGDYQNAIDYFHQGLPLLRAAGRKVEAAGALDDLGRTLVWSGQTRKGMALLRRALLLQRQLGNTTGEAVALHDFGVIYDRLGRKDWARRLYDLAIPMLHQAGERLRETAALLSLGRLQEGTGDLRGAAESYSRVLHLSEASRGRSDEAAALLGLAKIRRRQGDLATARLTTEKALDLIEALRVEPDSRDLRAFFLATKQGYYGFYIDLLMELHRREPAAGHDGQAFEASELARARSLLDVLALARADLRPRYAALGQAHPARLPAIQSLLDPDTLLLEYTLGKERSFLWAVTTSSLASFQLPPQATIEEAARRTLSLLASRQWTAAQRGTEMALEELSGLLLKPVAGQLRKRLLIVGDGALHTLPFGALPIPGRSGGPPLIADHEVLSLPSASALAALRRESPARSAKAGTVAVLADPVFTADDPRVTHGAAAVAAALRGGDPPRLDRLPYAREEAEAIRELVPAGRRFEALDFDASRRTALSGALASYRIVHFATHAVLDSRYPELSAIVLSTVDERGRPIEGFLRVHDIYRLHLPADLVVLSACETALGREIQGEGLIGLTRAFFYAGARRVLVSLWPVDDRATAELMRRFYRAMLQHGLPPAAALQHAQNDLRREPGWQAPYEWAGFVLQGDWR